MRYWLKVPKTHFEYALSYGAIYDEAVGAFYVEGDIPEALEAFAISKPQRAPSQEMEAPRCCKCNSIMVLRRNRADEGQFWGCRGFPACTHTLPFKPFKSATELLSKKRESDGNNFYTTSSRTRHPRVIGNEFVKRIVLLLDGEKEALEWLAKPHPILGGRAPTDCIRSHEDFSLLTSLVNQMTEAWVAKQKSTRAEAISE